MTFGSQGGRDSAGLPLAYFLGLSLIHTPGALLYLDFENWQSTAMWTQLGFEQTVFGMVAFLCGVFLARSIEIATPQKLQLTTLSAAALAKLDRLALFYMCIGLACFMSMQFLSSIPSIGSISSALGSLMIVGACLRLWVARQSGKRRRWWQTILLLPLLPLLTLVKDGFLGFGTYWLLAIVSFLFNQSKRARLGYYLLAPLVAFVALSIFVNYMASRTEFRQMVWYQQIGISDRIERVVSMFENFEWLDFSNLKHRAAIDGRLNQNLIVGLAAERLESGQVSYAAGGTVGQMVLGLIPRALWPDKPAVGGGGAIVSQFTGMQFAEGTSVGAGQVLEFYVNFGTWGVIGGFLLYGWLIGKIDLRVIASLKRADQRGFLLWFLMGLALLQPGGNLLEIVVTVASSAIAGSGLGYLTNRYIGPPISVGELIPGSAHVNRNKF
jgi:hypothetical protein